MQCTRNNYRALTYIGWLRLVWQLPCFFFLLYCEETRFMDLTNSTSNKIEPVFFFLLVLSLSSCSAQSKHSAPEMAATTTAPATDDIVAEIPTYITVYKNGTIDRPRQAPFVPPSLHDPETGVSSKDIVITENPSISARLYLPKSVQSGKHTQDQKVPILVYFQCSSSLAKAWFSRTGSIYSVRTLPGCIGERISIHPLTCCLSAVRFLAASSSFFFSSDLLEIIIWSDCQMSKAFFFFETEQRFSASPSLPFLIFETEHSLFSPEPPVTGSTGFVRFFRFTPIHTGPKHHPATCLTQTGGESGSRLNRPDRPVRSGFKNTDFQQERYPPMTEPHIKQSGQLTMPTFIKIY